MSRVDLMLSVLTTTPPSPAKKKGKKGKKKTTKGIGYFCFLEFGDGIIWICIFADSSNSTHLIWRLVLCISYTSIKLLNCFAKIWSCQPESWYQFKSCDSNVWNYILLIIILILGFITLKNYIPPMMRKNHIHFPDNYWDWLSFHTHIGYY